MLNQQLSNNSRTNARLAAIGAYEPLPRSLMDRLFRLPFIIQWSAPESLRNDLTTFMLRFILDSKPSDGSGHLEGLLDAWDIFLERFPEYVPQFKDFLLDIFYGCYLDDLPPDERAEYLGEDLTISREAILRHVTEGVVGLSWTGSLVVQQVWFDVDWDPEHGITIKFDAAGDLVRPWIKSKPDEIDDAPDDEE